MRTILVASLFLLTLVPAGAAEPDPPECYDRQPIVDAGVVEIWWTRSCTLRVVVDEDAVDAVVPEPGHKDVYVGKYNCPIGFTGSYQKTAIDTAYVTVWKWECHFNPGPPL